MSPNLKHPGPSATFMDNGQGTMDIHANEHFNQPYVISFIKIIGM